MSKYIDADSLLTRIKAYRPYQYLGEDALSYAIKMVELEPFADVRENVRGYWEKRKEKPLQNWYQCSNCGAICGETPNYCSECGADMRGDKT